MKKDIESLLPVISEAINANNGKIRIFPKGKSMLPLIKEGIDSVVLEKADNIKKYDIVLFLGNDKKYSLHRICKIKGDFFFLSGDNQSVFEKIRKEQIVAKVSDIYKGDILLNTESKKYKNYIYKIVFFRPFRRIIRKLK